MVMVASAETVVVGAFIGGDGGSGGSGSIVGNDVHLFVSSSGRLFSVVFLSPVFLEVCVCGGGEGGDRRSATVSSLYWVDFFHVLATTLPSRHISLSRVFSPLFNSWQSSRATRPSNQRGNVCLFLHLHFALTKAYK